VEAFLASTPHAWQPPPWGVYCEPNLSHSFSHSINEGYITVLASSSSSSSLGACAAVRECMHSFACILCGLYRC
jgi:hypothetical protein